MERVSVLCLLLLLCSLSGAKLQDNEIIEQIEASPESVNVPEQPQPCPSDLHSVLADMNAKLTENRLMIQQLQTLNQEQAAKLMELQKTEVDPIKEQLKEQAAKLRELQITELDPIKEQLKVGQVAFSASLLATGTAGHIGPFNAHTTLVFRHVVSNIGNAYNSNTGFFIAPVRGAYHFEFYICGIMDGDQISSAGLVKNGEHVFVASERQDYGWGTSANGATLLLEAGDVVFVRLWATTKVYDNEDHHTTFSGHLLFPMH